MFYSTKIGSQSIKLEYDIWGKGKPILFLHGGGTDYHYYQSFIACLAKNYKVYSFSYPGFGKSANMKNYSLENYLFLIDNFLLQMNLKDLAIVGHSMGAGLAAAYISNSVNKIKLALLISPFLYSYKKSIFKLASDLSRQGIIEKDYIPNYKNINTNQISLILSKLNQLPKTLNLIKLYLFLTHTDINKYLSFEVPCIGIIGKEDIVLNIKDQLQGLNKIKNIDIMEYDNFGHNVLFAKKYEILDKIKSLY